ncbi:TonB family protein [Melioribacteraceae bacterium 4301-Me]|uniref:TonB family protein n=1 Tax=Pyranulibacter aquaticus TaxID=3163344 RepID=UPI0035983E77
MFKKNTQNISYLISFGFHLALLLIFMAINFSTQTENTEYITVGFGSFGNPGLSGAAGKSAQQRDEVAEIEKQKVQTDKEEKKVELPKTVNFDQQNPIPAASNKKEKEEKTAIEKVKPLKKTESESRGEEFAGSRFGSFGFQIDFGGKGIRKIYSYILPQYPEGVSKEIDVKLKFTIMPDGTVGKIFPLIKADAKLEMAAINSLRQWRFEPLPPNAKQIEQSVVITFPYRLK